MSRTSLLLLLLVIGTAALNTVFCNDSFLNLRSSVMQQQHINKLFILPLTGKEPRVHHVLQQQQQQQRLVDEGTNIPTTIRTLISHDNVYIPHSFIHNTSTTLFNMQCFRTIIPSTSAAILAMTLLSPSMTWYPPAATAAAAAAATMLLLIPQPCHGGTGDNDLSMEIDLDNTPTPGHRNELLPPLQDPSPPQPPPPSTKMVAWVGTLDGGLCAMDVDSGNVLWSANLGGAMLKSFQAPETIDTGVVVPGVDGTAYILSDGLLRRFPFDVAEFVQQSPAFQVLPNGRRLTLVGSMTSKVYQVDSTTGKIMQFFTGDEGSTTEQQQKQQHTDDSSTNIIFVSRRDYRVRAFDEATAMEVWNFTFGVLEPPRGGTEESHNMMASVSNGGNTRSPSTDIMPVSEVDADVIVSRARGEVLSAFSGRGRLLSITNPQGDTIIPTMEDSFTGDQAVMNVDRFLLADGKVQLYATPDLVISSHLARTNNNKLPGDKPHNTPEPVVEADSKLALEVMHPGMCITDPALCIVRPGHHRVVPLLEFELDERLSTSSSPHLGGGGGDLHIASSSPVRIPNSYYYYAIGLAMLVVVVLVIFVSSHRRRTQSSPPQHDMAPTSLDNHAMTTPPITSKRRTSPHDSTSTSSSTTVANGSIPFNNNNDDNFNNNMEDGHRVGKLLVHMDRVKGIGCNGTIVVEGSFDGRAVAVKRMQSALYDRASKEVDLLIRSEGHANVVRYLAKEETPDFVYLALELCKMTLDQAMGEWHKDWRRSPTIHGNKVGEATRRFLQELASATHHLHMHNIVHCDIKPQNVLVIPRYASDPQVKNAESSSSFSDPETHFGTLWIPKLSDMGLSRTVHPERSSIKPPTAASTTRATVGGAGTVGWRAPELLEGATGSMSSRVSRKVDVFALGCVFFFVVEEGEHPFGESLTRESNIVQAKLVNLMRLEVRAGGGAEARHLIGKMCNKEPLHRPPMGVVVRHPLLWDAKSRLDFVCDVSDRVEEQPEIAAKLEPLADDVFPVSEGWFSKLSVALRQDVLSSKHRKYDAKLIRDLLRYIRNKRHHREKPELKGVLSWAPEQFLLTFCSQDAFPNLLPIVYDFVLKTCSHEAKFERILGSEVAEMAMQANLQRVEEETRVRRQWMVKDTDWCSQGVNGNNKASLPSVSNQMYKTILCAHWEKSGGTKCVMGDRCGFAHGLIELRNAPGGSVASSSGVATSNAVVVGATAATITTPPPPPTTPTKNSSTIARPSTKSRSWFIDEWETTEIRPPRIAVATWKPDLPKNFKTILCEHWEHSDGTFCGMSRKCGFAHGLADLRILPSSGDDSDWVEQHLTERPLKEGGGGKKKEKGNNTKTFMSSSQKPYLSYPVSVLPPPLPIPAPEQVAAGAHFSTTGTEQHTTTPRTAATLSIESTSSSTVSAESQRYVSPPPPPFLSSPPPALPVAMGRVHVSQAQSSSSVAEDVPGSRSSSVSSTPSAFILPPVHAKRSTTDDLLNSVWPPRFSSSLQKDVGTTTRTSATTTTDTPDDMLNVWPPQSYGDSLFDVPDLNDLKREREKDVTVAPPPPPPIQQRGGAWEPWTSTPDWLASIARRRAVSPTGDFPPIASTTFSSNLLVQHQHTSNSSLHSGGGGGGAGGGSNRSHASSFDSTSLPPPMVSSPVRNGVSPQMGSPAGNTMYEMFTPFTNSPSTQPPPGFPSRQHMVIDSNTNSSHDAFASPQQSKSSGNGWSAPPQPPPASQQPARASTSSSSSSVLPPDFVDPNNVPQYLQRKMGGR